MNSALLGGTGPWPGPLAGWLASSPRGKRGEQQQQQQQQEEEEEEEEHQQQKEKHEEEERRRTRRGSPVVECSNRAGRSGPVFFAL
jgi:hypothetical protein